MPEPPDAPFSLQNRVAIVTGASRGIGQAIAAGLSQAGARVIGISRTGSGDVEGITHRPCDITDQHALAGLFSAFERELQAVDILVNAAAVSLPAGNPDCTSEIARMRRTLDVDVVSAYATVLFARPLLAASAEAV